MDTETYLAFCVTATLLILAPGPSVMVVVAHALTWGARRSLFTILGIAVSHAGFFLVTAVGVATLLSAFAQLFTWLKLVGAAYLIWLGIKQWRASPESPSLESTSARSAWSMFFQGVAVNTTNPKALVFYAAFFPPFLEPDAAVAPQLAIMGATFVALLILLSLAYAVVAEGARSVFRSAESLRLQNGVTGSLMIGAGVGLAAARNE